ncbi:chaperone modulator CbpM [Caldovatus aquaticus]|uniref:Chaperone modulator CbpM n=1 Tax=Caldovatus aquaticus TaxID=2865671 RepID=A0ABS7EZG5_9PROT|nr:chaperone modulator CbpM [Caldovatus aquaticus]MBW8268694.1 chaperone modulator CbpM [Caldovatus aquaticus]
MIARAEFLLRAGIAERTFEAWIEAGWIGSGPDLSEAELARAALIRDLTERLGVNEEGVDVALALLDQIHGLRRALRQVGAALAALPEPARAQVLAALRGEAREDEG